MLVGMSDDGRRLQPRPVAASVDELLAGATNREPFLTSDSKSGSHFERVWIEGEPHIVKYIHVDHDFTMRGLGDLGPRPLVVWQVGLMDVAPHAIDHAMVGAAGGLGRNGWGAALLMRDVSQHLVPPGDAAVPHDQHLLLLDNLAAMSAVLWGWDDDVDLVPFEARWQWFVDESLETERALGWPEHVCEIAFEGWQRFAERAPEKVRDVVLGLRRDNTPLVDAIRETPKTFIHGDWKAGNLGFTPDGRTILIDWTYPGSGPVCHELAWHLSINSARLPVSKEATIDELHAALRRHGIDTSGWWEKQVGLCLLGAMVQHGWEKSFGTDAEFGWWCDRALEGAGWLK